MIAYVDTSVLLRLVLGESGRLEEITSYDGLVSSELAAVEALRTIDRLRHQGSLSTNEAVARRKVTEEWLEAVDLVLVRRVILARASDPLPIVLGTLDAIHLATALAWRDSTQRPLVMATHDGRLAQAARAFGMEVVGA